MSFFEKNDFLSDFFKNQRLMKQCIECHYFWCRTYFRHKHLWLGWCHILKQEVEGEAMCRLPPKQRGLFDFGSSIASFFTPSPPN